MTQEYQTYLDPLLRPSQIYGDKKTNVPPLIPISRSQFFVEVAAGRFPPPDVRLGARTIMWKLSTINAWVEANITQAARRYHRKDQVVA